MIRMLPNMFTIGNLFLGMVALFLAFNDQWQYAAITVIAGMLFDGLDGKVARLLNAESEFGKELDSLCDIVTFGVAPAVIMYIAILQPYGFIGWVVAAAFPACGALRLARFNVVKGTPGYFVGLPITAAGGVLATMALYKEVVASPLILIFGMLALAYLMVSSLKYPNFKKVGVPKQVFWLGPIVIALAVFLAIKFPSEFPKLVFIPLFAYAIWGITKNVRKHKGDDHSMESDIHY
ncbi:CDP-diacylglycerol--serine O-phosphatidyltransferase [Numidum massiliense]|uniref:CDP-diacylglycerol--serine O-phosphatidyltransferase n=1 Tax=Numidum massiliense TaxID=1522315 RepID=UPI0006D5A870|nr:CDP-diacylglycerol--serine O-phosphatidyltransferase [Numidum massiliense]